MWYEPSYNLGSGWRVPAMFSGEVGSNKDAMGVYQKPYVSPEYKKNQQFTKEVKSLYKADAKREYRILRRKRKMKNIIEFPIEGKGSFKGQRIKIIKRSED